MASIEYIVRATDAASGVFKKIALSADSLDRQLADLSKRVATPEVDLKDAKFTLGMINAAKRLDKLSAMVADPAVDVDTAKAQTEILRITAMLDRLDRKHVTSTVTIRQRISGAAGKAAGAGFSQPSAMGTALALSPALIPLSAGIAAGVGAIAVSFGAAVAGAGAFGLLAKSALTQAGTAATAVDKAQTTYNAAIASGTKRSTAYRAEQKAIMLAYADMSPQQIKLSKQVGDLQNAWQGVQKSLAPVISGALVPWLHAATDAMKLIKPFIIPIAAVFKDWGISLQKYFSSTIVAEQLRQIAVSFGKFSASQLRDIGSFLVNIGAAVFHLGTDLAANGVNFGAFGDHLKAWGKAFDTWSKSAKARADVQGFLHYLHTEGPVVKSILSDLGKILPGIFKGVSTTGTLELSAVSGFLGFIAGLPKGWQAPLTEAAGAILLLSKTGVVKVGLKLTGKLAEHPTALGFSIGTLLAAGIIDAVNKHDPGKKSIWQRFSPPSKGQQQTWLNSWSGLGDRVVFIARHDIAGGVERVWNFLWDNTIGITKSGGHQVEAAWNTIWAGVKGIVASGIKIVVGFFKGLPGKAVAALAGLGTKLWNLGNTWLTDLWHGIEKGASGILGWFSGFVGKILGFLAKLTGHSPSGEFYFAGQKMMTQLAAGIKSRAHHAASAAQAAARRVSSGALGGDALANQALARRIFPWPSSQWGPFVSLVMAESGFNRFARNPSSGAYGIAQALPPTKYPFAGQAAGGSHAGAQLSWMFDYIRGRYGTPAGAWAHELSAHWYGGGTPPGGILFSRPQLIGVGDRPERVEITPVGQGATRAGALVHIDNFNSYDATDPVLLGQRLSFAVTTASLGS